MAKFNFRLKRVLDYKRQIEEQTRLELAKVLSEMSKKREELKNTRDEMTSISHKFSQGVVGENNLWLYQECERSLIEEEVRLKKEISEISHKMESLKRDLVLKTIERKKLEKLEQKEKRGFIHEEQKKEQKEIDEMATIRYEGVFK